MDGRHFDLLTRNLTAAGTRRSLLGLLASLPILGGLFALVDLDETNANGRRKRRKKRHKHGKGHRRKHQKRKPKCTPDATTTTCAGRCGSVTNNCRQPVDCGSCTCTPPCEECFACQEGAAGVPGTCVAEEASTPCGAATFCSGGTLFPQGSCDGDGNCMAGVETPCYPYIQCDGNACATTCDITTDCDDGFYCDNADHCVAQGEPGDTCDTSEQCLSGFCANNVCCTTACDGGCDVCDVSGDGTCTTISCGSGQVCVSNGTCALTCSGSPDPCVSFGNGCSCRGANTGQLVCQDIDFPDCRCVADCSLCAVGEVCQGTPTGQCPSGPKCCPVCGV